jgi:uncharacterized protein YciW
VVSNGATPEILQEWTARLTADTQHREHTAQQAKQADTHWRESIKSASRAGLTAPQIAAVVGVSPYRVYQINKNRRT